MGHARALFGGAAAPVAAVACAQGFGARFDAPPTGSPADGTSDASPDGEVCAGDPEPKETADGGSDSDLDLAFAMRCLNFGDGDGTQNVKCSHATTPGFNLDSACSTQC